MTALRFERVEAASAVRQAEDRDDPIAAFRRRQQQLAALHTKDFDLPGYRGEYVVRYRRLKVDEYRNALFGSSGSEVEANAQFLIDACDGIYRRRQDDSLHPLWPSDQIHRPTEAPRYGDLDEILGIDEDRTVRQSVLAVFGGHEIALNEHSADVERWMRSIDESEEEDLSGG